ncbi:uncharacterized protein LOC131591187 [Poecile atricapillus]|uniref:uncharacterized protein LOC131591187 n=1 Tax=Poecile atricapillus TaxID=48891 RepID=UPI002738EEA4|nr:uncharacterized protein LOC131591187 [Poecile atricapillus]
MPGSSEASPGLPTTTTAAARTFVPVLEDVGVAAAPLPLLALPLPPAPPPARHFKSARPDVPQSVPRNCLMEGPRAEQRPEEGTEGTRERRGGRGNGGEEEGTERRTRERRGRRGNGREDEGTEGRTRERRRGGANGGEEELKPRKCSGTGHGRTATWRRPRSTSASSEDWPKASIRENYTCLPESPSQCLLSPPKLQYQFIAVPPPPRTGPSVPESAGPGACSGLNVGPSCPGRA